MNYIVLDTETTNDIETPLTYDDGWAIIVDNKVVATRNYVVAEIFLNEELMSCAHFADKIPQYWEEIKSGVRELRSIHYIRKQLQKDCRDYNISRIYAHNAKFDYKSLQTTYRYVTTSEKRWFIPYGVEMFDSLKMARTVFANDENYTRFCVENNYLTKRGQKKFTAEVLYRFISGNNDFIEEHTGLADVMIEKEIVRICYEMMPSVDGRLWASSTL